MKRRARSRMRVGVCVGAIAALLGIAPSIAGGAMGSVAPGKLKIVDSGFLAERDDPDSWIEIDAAAALTNPTGKVALDVYYAVRITDTKGKLLEERDSQHLAYVLPGVETYLVQDIDLFDAAPDVEVGEVTFKVTEIDELVAMDDWTDFQGKPETSVPVEDVLEFSDFGVQQTDFVFDVLHGSVTNTSDELLSGSPFAVDVSCGLYRGGELVGGGYDQISVLPPGQPVAVMDKLAQSLDPDEVRCSGEISSLSARPADSEASEFEVVSVTMTPTVGGDLRVAANIATTSDKVPQSVTADWEFKDAQGRAVGSAFESFDLEYLLPGVEVTVEGGPESPQFLSGTAASVEVRISANDYLAARDFEDLYGFAPDDSPFDVTDVEISQDDTIATITGTVENRSNREHEVTIHCAVYAGDVLLGSAVALDVPVAAKSSEEFTTDFGSLTQTVTDASVCFALASPSYG